MTTSVLVVDDEIIIATGIEKRLAALGYNVVALATSGEEAIQLTLELRPEIILMDINLGQGMDGVESAGIIRKLAGIPVVYLTAHTDEATLQRAKLTDPFGYVVKPYDDIDLRTAIEVGLYKNGIQRRLWDKRQRLAAILSSIADGVIALDSLSQISFMNPVAERLTGWTLDDAIGQDVADVFHIVEEATRCATKNPAVVAIETGEVVCLAENIILIGKAGNECFIEDSASPIWDEEGRSDGAVLVFRDITERRQLQEHLRQAQKLEAIGRLAGGIAHDFNNIMTIILGYGELLKDESTTANDQRIAVEQICSAGNRAAALTQQIMAFSRKQMLVTCVLNLNTVVRDMSAMARRLIGEHIEFTIETVSDLSSVLADPTQIGQVILNLVSNARDAMPNGGRLVITTANEELDESTARLHPDVKPGRYALLSVTDTGSGMTQEHLTHIFEPFFTTKGVGKGTGLGLAMVHGIVKQSGGHVEVTSKLGAGTTFRVYLPVVSESQQTPHSHEVRIETKGHETVLLVEDEATVRRLTKLILEQSGYTVLEASAGAEALHVASMHSGPIDLLLTDLVMPGMTARDVAEQLAVARPSIRVMYMSGYTEDMIVRHGVESATTDFLHKPFTPTELTKQVRTLLDRN